MVDIPGFPLISTYNIQVTQLSFTFQHINFIVDTSDTGRGIYRSGGTGIKDIKLNDFSLHIFPNPFQEKLNINYKLNEGSYVNLEILDVSGKIIETIINTKQNKGEYSYTFNNKKLIHSEIYFIKFVVNNTVYMKKVIGYK